eukprot:CAMPEP_0180136208 /NCGR_PEP_ID=MMETSP0986-20121125/11349_1 /TAXON_ID=697907 /ORGANISM="non described non described, Strain CCMP2293" /LENGTH=96 /DNA_ID=CAMNT_0022077173 /DNA_START=62 /DNA_END=351 /DNA_ORIENTATION=+
MVLAAGQAVSGLNCLERALLARAEAPSGTPLYCAVNPTEGQGTARFFATEKLHMQQQAAATRATAAQAAQQAPVSILRSPGGHQGAEEEEERQMSS